MQDNEAVMMLLDSYDAGILGEEVDGTLRVAFGRTCEMVSHLVTSLLDVNKDLVFPAFVGSSLHLNIVPRFECKDIAANVYDSFVWLPNQTGIYTMSKRSLAGSTLRQLFAQLEENVFPLILEDEPGTDNLYLHVQKGPIRQKAMTDGKIEKPDSKNNLNLSKLWMWVFVLSILLAIIAFEPLHPHHEWALKLVSTVYMNLPTFRSS